MFPNSNNNNANPFGQNQQQANMVLNSQNCNNFNQVPQIQNNIFQQYQNQVQQQVPQFQMPQMQINQNAFGSFNQQQQLFSLPPSFPPQNFGAQINYQYSPPNQSYQTIQGEDDELNLNLQQAVTKQSSEIYDLENNLSFEIKALYQSGKLLDSRPQYLPGMISIKTKEIQLEQSKQQRAGVDLVCVIDRSGSMWGEKIQMVQQTLNVLLDFLTEKDRLQLITFDDHAQKLTPLKKINEVNKQQLKKVISTITADGSNNMAAATNVAFQQLKHRKQRNNVTSIFILSDGVDPTEHEIRQQMTNMNEVLTIHSFGFGADHDAQMMTNICNLGKGSFYFVQNIKLLDEFFADALGGLMSVVGTEIQVDICCQPASPYQDIHLAKTYGKVWLPIQDKRKYQIKIPQISSGSRKDFVFEIGLPKLSLKIQDQQRNSNLVEAKIKIKNPINGKVITKNSQLTVTFYNQDEQIKFNEQDVDVAVQYYRVKATETIEEAKKKCDQNQNEDAQTMIEAMIVAIKNNQKVAALSAGIIQDLQQAKQGSSKQSYRIFGQKQMCQQVSNNYNQSGTNAMFSANGQQMQQQLPQMHQNMFSYNMMQQVQQKKS